VFGRVFLRADPQTAAVRRGGFFVPLGAAKRPEWPFSALWRVTSRFLVG